jgi:hypothetical protein
MTSPRFTKVPEAVFDGAQAGEITLLQFTILVWLHHHADFVTGIVKSWSAEIFCREMGHGPDLPSLNTIRRAARELREAGWFHWDYVKGSKRPYKIWLHNFSILRGMTGCDGENGGDRGGDPIVLNPYDVKACINVANNRGGDDGGDGGDDRGGDVDGEVVAKDQIRATPFTDQTRSNAARLDEEQTTADTAAVAAASGADSASAPSPGGENQQRGHENLRSRLDAILYWLPTDALTVARRLLTRFDADEIVDAVAHGIESGTVIPRDPPKIKKLFAENGARLDICIREYREHLEAKAESEKRERDRRLAEEKIAAEKKAVADKRAAEKKLQDAKDAEAKHLGDEWRKEYRATWDDFSIDPDEWAVTHPPAGDAVVESMMAKNYRAQITHQAEQKARAEAEKSEQEAAAKLVAERQEIVDTMVCPQCGPNGYLVWIEDRGWKCESCDGLNVMPITPEAFALSESVVDEILRRIPSQDRSVARKIYHDATDAELQKIGIVRPT